MGSKSHGWTHTLPIVTLVAAVACADPRPDVTSQSTTPEAANPLDGRRATSVPSRIWTVADSPDLLLAGGEVGGDSIFLHGITDARFLSDGGFLVGVGGGSDGPNMFVRFDLRGRIVETIGRTGDGPGEFRSVRSLWGGGGEVGVWDQRARRFSWYSEAGDLVGDAPFERSVIHIVGVVGGDLIVTTPPPYGIDEGTLRPYLLWSREGEPAGELAGPGEPANGLIRVDGIVDDPFGNPMAVFGQVSLASDCFPETLHGVAGSRIIAADAGDGVVYAIARGGDATVIFEGSSRARVSAEMVQKVRETIGAMREGLIGRGARDLSDVSHVLDRIGSPGSPLPSMWSRLVVDRGGRIWLRRATCLSGGATDLWEVLDSSGIWLAEVVLPKTMRLLAIDEDRVMGTMVDALDIERIAILGLHR